LKSVNCNLRRVPSVSYLRSERCYSSAAACYQLIVIDTEESVANALISVVDPDPELEVLESTRIY
jgi:hypothetical protein